MKFRQLIITLSTILLLLFLSLPVVGEVIVVPHGIAEAIEGDEQMELEVTLVNTSDQDVNFKVDIEDQELGDDDRNASPRRDRRGGPADDDEFGYEWRDNDENDGPEYEWIDIREFDDVQEQVQQDDEIHGAFNFGWDIPFFNREYNRCWICSDGWTSLQRSQYQRNVPDFPNNDQSWFATVLWSDGDWHGNQGGGPAYFWTNEEDIAIVTWHQWSARDNGTLADVQVIFQDNGMITIQYGDNFGEGNRFDDGQGTYGAEAGINGLGGDYPGFQFKPPNQLNDYLIEGRAIGFGPSSAWITWVVTDPEEGVIEAESELDMNLLLNSEELEEGNYYAIIRLVDPDNEDNVILEFPALMSVDVPAYTVSGVITDAENEDPIEGASITTDPYGICRYSDDEGNWEINNLFPGEYEFTFTAVDYLTFTEDVVIEEEDVELDVEFLHSECTPSEDEFMMELEPDMEHEFEFEVVNDGNGPLVYWIERRLLGDADADPWELREVQNSEETADDNQLNGVIFAADHYFISGGNRREDDNKIYVFNRDGELVREFDQFHQSDYGMRDLCWDGELIWGSDDGILYGFDIDGELIHEIRGEADSYRSLTYDRENERFISADITSDIYISDSDGELVRTIDRPGDLRTYGLAYWPDDPDSYNLYAFGRGEETDVIVNKINLENGGLSVAAELNIDGGRPGGICITNTLDIYSWVFIGMVQNPDRIAVWQLEGRREWFQIEPEAGEIGADDSEGFVLTLDATDLPSDNAFRGILVYHHDGVGSQTEIPVELNVVEGEIHTTRELNLQMGWNMVSVNLQPDEEDVEVLMADLVEADQLVMMKDDGGHFYSPAYDFNNIPGWFVDKGYLIKMREPGRVELEGWTVVREEPIELEAGWQLVSY
ncbi:MAG: carboxypeptidase-like regulatory domain-containing protein, partial [Candidatus Hatepunaea meridiana]|nr:carboxypeptidase-like regulatory domain-containing protein [Candidatus Hatepunaea meridiana]